MLDTKAREPTTSQRTVSDVQLKKSVGVISDVFKPGHRKTFAVAADAVSSIIDTSTDLQNPAPDVFIVENEIVMEYGPWDLRDLSSKNDRGHTPLQRIQELCRCY